MQIPQRFLPSHVESIINQLNKNVLQQEQIPQIPQIPRQSNGSLQRFDHIENVTTVKSEQNQSQRSIDIGSDIAITPYKDYQLNSPSFTYQQNFRVVLQNWANKKTLNSVYQPRYFVLTPTRLLYFSDQSKKQLKGCFNFISLLKHTIITKSTQFQIKIKVNPAGYQSQFQNRYILQIQFNQTSTWIKWCTQLQKILTKLKQIQQVQLLSQELIKPSISMLFPSISIENLIEMNTKISNQINCNFWNRVDISEYQLREYSSHLDVLLMRSKHPVSYFSRFFMRSYYDHVALILKSQLHQIYIFEAIESRGVCIMDLDTFLKINKDVYEEIAFRKLSVNQTPEELQQGLYKGVHLERLQIYLNSLLGKKYELSLSKLFLDGSEYCTTGRRQYNLYPVQSNRVKIQQDPECTGFKKIVSKNSISYTKVPFQMGEPKPQKTYFCSELVADIYLKFGLILQGKSKDFWPKDFQQNDIKWRQGITFSPIMNVRFQQTSTL